MYSILAADIGGTNSRFAAVSGDAPDNLTITQEVRLETGKVSSFDELLQALSATGFPLSAADADISAIAVPGPVQGQSRATAANVDYEFDTAALPDAVGKVVLLNDFAAQAFACRTPAVKDALLVKAGDHEPGSGEGPLAVIGAGTGLGHCALHTLPGGGYLAAPSEAGHATFSFFGTMEYNFADFLMEKYGVDFVFGDQVVTGSGLSDLHEFLTGDAKTPAEVAQTITPDSRTAVWFSRFFGRAARNYFFNVVSEAGIYIAGGVAAKNPWLVDSDAFRSEFLHSPKYQSLLRGTPVLLNANEQSGLYGAALFGLLSLAGKS